MRKLNTVVEMSSASIKAVEDMEAEITRVGVTAFWFEVDSPLDVKLWPSEELDRNLVNALRVGDHIVYSAESDDHGDLIMTKFKVCR